MSSIFTAARGLYFGFCVCDSPISEESKIADSHCSQSTKDLTSHFEEFELIRFGDENTMFQTCECQEEIQVF